MFLAKKITTNVFLHHKKDGLTFFFFFFNHKCIEKWKFTKCNYAENSCWKLFFRLFLNLLLKDSVSFFLVSFRKNISEIIDKWSQSNFCNSLCLWVNLIKLELSPSHLQVTVWVSWMEGVGMSRIQMQAKSRDEHAGMQEKHNLFQIYCRL